MARVVGEACRLTLACKLGILLPFQPLSQFVYLRQINQQNNGMGVPLKAGRYLSLQGIPTHAATVRLVSVIERVAASGLSES